MLIRLLHLVLCLSAAPLLPGIINKTKAFFAGRNGPPLFQLYYDLWKLARKGAVYSRTTSFVFRAAPVMGLSAVFAAALLVPLGGLPAVIAFQGDLIVFVYLFALVRFFTVIGALDTGSSFEGMGAAREVTFSALSEPALLIGLAAIAKFTGQASISQMFALLNFDAWPSAGPVTALFGIAMIIVFLAENCRIPVDDPNTHLELTMIHEVMVLDYSGPDFGMILYTAALKMWLLGTILAGVLMPVHTGVIWMDTTAAIVFLILLAVFVGIIESSMARLRLLHVPPLLIGATALSILALVLVFGGLK
jgi:formate hydrogenlyase subunit 4